ncbi:DEKNAAC105045 [Brettanomyces naardenensis]|uniref:Sulfhydryl oxidase n=1 Tax=Brettanomyces naardenensis TaxID=13370 RepID=A0A448YS76_BRENA|nr:DEKNAAC105045 [Brettanomyces naardenensis]
MAMPELNEYPVPEGKPAFGPDGRKIIYDEDGKPCRTCNSLLNFRMATAKEIPKGSKSASSSVGTIAATSMAALASKPVAKDCPPDVEELGRSTWTFLHSVAAMYPEHPTDDQQQELKTFMVIFSKIYPCWFCAKGFQKFMKKNEPKVTNQEEFGRWLCDAHNAVNEKLGKPKFDCNLWKKRWKDGWDDGRCD